MKSLQVNICELFRIKKTPYCNIFQAKTDIIKDIPLDSTEAIGKTIRLLIDTKNEKS